MQGKPSLPPKPVTDVWRPDLVRLPRLTLARRVFRIFGHGFVKIVAKVCLNVSVEGLENYPKKGPVLVVINHIGDADIAAIVSTFPFPPDALGKIELYEELSLLGKLMDWYGIIWLHRGRADVRALRAALEGFKEGRAIVIAPEGRYSPTGQLEEGNDGAAYLAYKSGAPILPIAVTGTENENIYSHMKRLKRALVHVKVGKMFKLENHVSDRQEAMALGTRQIMSALANLLPEKYRGEYSS